MRLRDICIKWGRH